MKCNIYCVNNIHENLCLGDETYSSYTGSNLKLYMAQYQIQPLVQFIPIHMPANYLGIFALALYLKSFIDSLQLH